MFTMQIRQDVSGYNLICIQSKANNSNKTPSEQNKMLCDDLAGI